MKVITHNDRFHADDVFATAVVRIKFGKENLEIIRTRDEEIIQIGDIVLDVGSVYNPENNRFDHHQGEGAGVREDGVPYASFGLVWKKWGEEICDSKEAAESIDKKLVQIIDASDNGFALYSYNLDDVKEYTFDTICGAFGPSWKEEPEYDKGFFEMVEFAEKILRREIKLAKDKVEAIPFVEKAYEDAEDKRLVVLDEYYPWGNVLSDHAEVLFVISPNKEKTMWRVNAVQEGSFVNRKDLPQEWAGLRDEELEKVSGVEGVLFCHRKLFMAATKTKESAIKLAKIAIES